MTYYIPASDKYITSISMFQDVRKVFIKYIQTLKQIGYISKQNTDSLPVYIFIDNYLSLYKSSLEDKDKRELLKIIDCIKSKSCLFK